jgi:hypothetical protein
MTSRCHLDWTVPTVRLRAAERVLHQAMTELSREHRRWLKRLVSGKVPDAEWPIGINRRSQLQVLEPGQSPPPITVVSEAEAGRPLP